MTKLPNGKAVWRQVPSRCHDARKTKAMAVGIVVDDFGHAYIKLRPAKTRKEQYILVDSLHDMIIKSGVRR